MNEKDSQRIFFGILLLLVTAAFVWLIRGFLQPVFWAVALGIVFFSGKSPEIGSPVGPVAEIAEITEIAPGASVALLDTPGEARVIDLTMGEARVVMIFDQELDL